MKLFLTTILLLTVVSVLSDQATAQKSSADAQYDQYVELLRKDLRSEKKQLVAANMNLSEAEAVKFWPVYDRYTTEGVKLNDARIALVKEYAASIDKMTDAQAMNLSRRSIEIDEQTSRLRQKYVPLFGKVLPGRKSAFFFQVDKRLALLIDLQLASEIPMLEP